MTPTNQDVAAWRAVLLAQSRALRAIEADLDAEDAIPLTWYDVLLELDAAGEDGLRMQELGLRAVLSRTRISRLVTELERAGLVERKPDPDDGRASLATITKLGRSQFRATAPLYLRGIEQHFSQYLTKSQQASIASGLQRVIDAHQATLDPRR